MKFMFKKQKNWGLILVLISFLSLFNSCHSSKTAKITTDYLHWIAFHWEGDSIGSKYYQKLAMTIPFRFEKIPFTFKSQFDLGAPSTMVYGNTVDLLLKKYPFLKAKLDTVHKYFMIQGKRTGAFKNISFYLDTVLFKHQNIAYFQGYGDSISEEDLSHSKNLIIGTIGSNLFKNKILIIDFPNQRLTITDSLPVTVRGKLIDIQVKNGRILIPVIINNKKYNVLYDSGTSMASLFLSTKNWDQFRDVHSRIDSIESQAWGTKFYLFQSKTNIRVQIGNVTIKPDSIMANGLPQYYNFYKQMGIIGIMGNRMFYDKTILIDFKNHRFGIIKLN